MTVVKYYEDVEKLLEIIAERDSLRAQLHLANVDAANKEAEANDLRAQLAAAQRVPEDAELDGTSYINDDIYARSRDAITALHRRVAELTAQRDDACDLADRITNQRRERCPTCFGDVTKGEKDA